MSSMGIRALVRSNLQFWLEDTLLREGLYVNVNNPQTDIYGNDISLLIPINNDPTYPSGTVFQSAFKNWVYESGITVTESGLLPPIVCSGVTVGGTFRAHDSGHPNFSAAHVHTIDFPNGRVIFSNPQSSPVNASFAYKVVTVDHADSFENENRPLLIETAYKDNPLQTGVQIYPSAQSRTLPAIWIEMGDRSSNGYELGSSSLIASYRGVLHIWSRDNFTSDLVEDILAKAQHSVIIGIDFNRASYPLNEYGDKEPSFTSYDEMADIYHSLRWRRIYLDEVKTRQQPSLYEVQRTRVDFLVRIYPNF
jgi:hypothetical protein